MILYRRHSNNCGCRTWMRDDRLDQLEWTEKTRKLLGLSAEAVRHLEDMKHVLFTAYGQGCLMFHLSGSGPNDPKVFYSGHDIASDSELWEAWQRLHKDT